MKANKIIWMALAILLGVGTGTAGAATNEVSALLQQGLFEEEANQNLDAAIQAYQSVIAQTDKNRQFAATAIFRLGECYRKQGKTNEAATQYQRIVRDFADQPELAKLSRQYLAGFGVAASTAFPADNADAKLLEKLTNRPQSELEKIIPTLAPDPVLTSLLQQRNEAETKLAQLRANEGALNPDVVAQQAVLDVINKQITDKIFGIMAALKMRAEISAPAASGAPAISEAALQTQKQLLDEEIKIVDQQVQTQQARVKLGVMSSDELSSTQMKLLELKRQRAALDTGQFISQQTPAAIANDEDKELARIQTMIQNTPDLINGANSPLSGAANMGQLRVVTFLLDHGANINGSPGNVPPIIAAAENDQVTMVELLLNRGADINIHNTDDSTALTKAVEKGYKSVVEVLLAHHANVNATSAGAFTPLHMAAQIGYTDLAGLLITNGADVNAAGNNGYTPLYWAAMNGNVAVMELLIAHKAAVDARDNNGETPLIVAVQHQKLDVAAVLLKDGADVNAKQNGSTPLHAAVAQNNREMVKLLLDNGADANARIASYNFTDRARGMSFNRVADVTPLIMAVMNREAGIVTLLIAHKADINATDASGDTALTVLAGIKLEGQDTTQPGSYPGYPLVSLKSQLAITDSLLAGGADVNAQNNSKQSALYMAVNNRSSELVKLLLQHKAKIDVVDSAGWTPMQRAVESLVADIAGSLLDAGADPNVRFPQHNGYWYDGYTMLGMAVGSADKPLVQVLLSHKADPNLPDDQGKTPLSIARQVQKDPRRDAEHQRAAAEITELLLKAGANENLHRLSTISVSRAGADYTQSIFSKGTNSFNHYTLLQLIMVFYEQQNTRSQTMVNGHAMSFGGGLAFPDFGKVKISRLQKDGRTNVIAVDLDKTLNSGDCSQDVPLEWGDVVDIPELDHYVGASWQRISDSADQTLWKCLGLDGKVSVVVRTQTNTVALMPEIWLYDVVHHVNVFTSSDLGRVRVTRIDPATRKPVLMVFDLQKKDPANDLWLRDGDVIEIPEKP